MYSDREGLPHFSRFLVLPNLKAQKITCQLIMPSIAQWAAKVLLPLEIHRSMGT